MMRVAAFVITSGGLFAAVLGFHVPSYPVSQQSRVARPLAAHPVERLLAAPAPLDAPESYLWADRQRFERDLAHHVADLHRQGVVLREGLASAAGPAPEETLRAIRRAEDGVIVELARLGAATPQSWSTVRLDVLEAVMNLGRAVERARRATSPGIAATITI